MPNIIQQTRMLAAVVVPPLAIPAAFALKMRYVDGAMPEYGSLIITLLACAVLSYVWHIAVFLPIVFWRNRHQQISFPYLMTLAGSLGLIPGLLSVLAITAMGHGGTQGGVASAIGKVFLAGILAGAMLGLLFGLISGVAGRSTRV